MPNLPNPVSYAVPAFVLFVVAEMIFARLHDRSRYHVKDTLTSLLLGLGSTVASVLTGGAVVVMGLALQRYAPFQIPYSWWA